jgi:hypothetical protein
MYERRHDTLLPFPIFLRRFGLNAGAAVVLITLSLLCGTVGYRYFAGLPWIDALLNAAMILTGMGPVDRMETSPAKLFATAYALFSGAVFLTTIAVLASPLLHRLMHSFHLQEEDPPEQRRAIGPETKARHGQGVSERGT